MRFLVRCVVLLVFAVTVYGQWPEQWRSWRYAAPIQLAPAGAGGLMSVRLPDSVTSRSRRGWGDVRIVDGIDREVPYLLRAQFGGRSVAQREVPLLEPTAVAGGYRQAVADAGPNPPVHNSLSLVIATDTNLMAFVEIAVSADMKEWRVVRDRAPIYALMKEGRGQNTGVSYPNSVSRYVRIRVLDGSTAYAITSAKLGYDLFLPAEREAASATFAASAPSGRLRDSVWTSEGDLSAFPISAVSFTTRQPSLKRSVFVAISDDGNRWTTVASDSITTQEGAESRAKLTVDNFPETYARRWRITVNHLNDAPVADLQPALLTVPRRVVFRPESGQSYRLLFGHPRASAPSYDISQLTDVTMLERAAAVTLGGDEENATWVDPAPWTERYDAVLWAALAAAAIVLGLAAMRALKAPAAAGAPRAA